MSAARRTRIAVLGAGAVGSVLARELARGGAEVVLWSRHPAHARAAARAARGASRTRLCVEPELERALAAAGIVLVCVRDDALATFARRAAKSAPRVRSGVVLHVSGALGADLLAPFAKRGWSIGSLHPLAPFVTRRGAAPVSLAGATWAVEARDARGRRVALDLVRRLRGVPLELHATRGAKASYHLAASIVANGSVALFDAAQAELARAGLSPRDAQALCAAALARIARLLAEGGLQAALSGPVARGELGVVDAHLARLGRGPRRELYLVLARALTTIARRERRIDASKARALRRRLA